VLQQQINQIRRFLSNAQTPDSVIAHRLPGRDETDGESVGFGGAFSEIKPSVHDLKMARPRWILEFLVVHAAVS